MKRHLLTHYKGKPLVITGWDHHWAARILSRSFTLGRWHLYEYWYKTNPDKPKDARVIRYVIFTHETGHTGGYEEAAGPEWGELGLLGKIARIYKVMTFLASYFPKALLRRFFFAIKKPQWAPRDLYEVNAETDGQRIAKGLHPDWTIPAETQAHFG